MAQPPQPSKARPPGPKKRGRDWGYLAFIAGILLIAIGTQVGILLWVGIALIIAVVVGIVVRMVKQMYF